MRRTLASAAAVAGLLVAGEPAGAAETHVAQTAAEVSVRSLDTVILADLGEENQIVVTEAPDGSLRIREAPGIPLVADAPCFLSEASEATCPGDAAGKPRLLIFTGKNVDSVQVDLPAVPARVASVIVAGGRNGDFLRGSAGPDTLFGDDGKGSVPPPSGEPVPIIDGSDAIWGAGGSDILEGEGGPDYLNGGFADTTLDPAANTLRGGAGRDFFDAGRTPGPDQFTGGSGGDSPTNASTLLNGAALINGATASSAGGDTVSYQTRTYTEPGSAGVTGDLDGAADDGSAGENDEIAADVEALTGTLRDDTLTGSAQDNRLTGGLGVDRLSGLAGDDRFMLKDGVRDRCFSKGAGDTVDADLADPKPEECPPFQFVMPPLFTFNAQPVDETIPYVVIGSRLRRLASGHLVARVRCPRSARRFCRGRLELAGARRGAGEMTRRRYRVRRGSARRVVLRPSRRELARLRSQRRARLTAVARGTSDIGPTTTSVVRRLR